jgi:hypothetical protein
MCKILRACPDFSSGGPFLLISNIKNFVFINYCKKAGHKGS